jgi:hypothetical protein
MVPCNAVVYKLNVTTRTSAWTNGAFYHSIIPWLNPLFTLFWFSDSDRTPLLTIQSHPRFLFWLMTSATHLSNSGVKPYGTSSYLSNWNHLANLGLLFLPGTLLLGFFHRLPHFGDLGAPSITPQKALIFYCLFE